MSQLFKVTVSQYTKQKHQQFKSWRQTETGVFDNLTEIIELMFAGKLTVENSDNETIERDDVELAKLIINERVFNFYTLNDAQSASCYRVETVELKVQSMTRGNH